MTVPRSIPEPLRDGAAARRQTARWPRGHLGWAFTGLPEFHGRVASFLAEGHVRGERQVFVADDPKPGLWPRRLLERGDLLVLSTAEVYGPARTVDPASQRAAFEEVLAQALAQGYTGLRVAADNTSLASSPDRVQAWMNWEHEADLLMQARPISGLCAFDRTRIGAPALEAIMAAHPRRAPVPLRAEAGACRVCAG